ncbi:Sec20-domain-containing protein [Neocallimastix lanati (nom. inval.)]|jgi:protein transport protein SEC20|uniref:Sec20-domain-containing protein n=1 Tax=Neocallimastix californiae TaxID=1754190 RepID=A0A1Y2EDB3_9FUNG|nr:Sec20-domain-containing protein [Neocallimastix sp. JGI-2020a]ORY69256.1 Sec20-domain-containing protein [Neocallimastix californiae]|eukprot:ORY69256.1 Sec20-domain-containing protein [Neocallimastix californiae]
MNAYPAEVRRHFENLSRLEIQIENKITELNVSSGPLTEITRINNSINYLLREYENLINEGYELAQEQDDGNVAKQMEKKLEKLKLNFKQHRLSLIKANQKAKQQMNMEILKEREELFKDSKGQNVRNRKRGANNKSLLKGHEELTDSLKQAVQMLTEEVQKSSQNSKLLDDSTSTLSKTTEEYKKYDNALNSNKKVVSSLKRRDFTDKILLGLGLLFFLCTVLYVVGKRIWIPKILFSKKGAAAVASSIKKAVKSSTTTKMAVTTTKQLLTTSTTSTTTSTATATAATLSDTIAKAASSVVSSVTSTIASSSTVTSTAKQIIKTIADEL